MNIVIIVLLFVLGAIFGSFGWVLISREWDKKWIKSIFFGRSKCEKCQKNLSATELIPLLSFFVQKGKCKTCRSKLSNFYWMIELMSGFVFVITYLFFPYNWFIELIFRVIINRSFLLLMIFDIQKHELHLPIWIFVTIFSFIFALLNIDFGVLVGSGLLFLFVFFLIYMFSKYYMKIRFHKYEEGFGQWDVYLSLTIWTLSWFVFYYNNLKFDIVNLVDLILIYVIFSCVIWLIYSLVNFITKIKQKNIIPFLPSMILSFWIVLLFGKFLINILK